jgi:hypothetical protein
MYHVVMRSKCDAATYEDISVTLLLAVLYMLRITLGGSAAGCELVNSVSSSYRSNIHKLYRQNSRKACRHGFTMVLFAAELLQRPRRPSPAPCAGEEPCVHRMQQPPPYPPPHHNLMSAPPGTSGSGPYYYGQHQQQHPQQHPSAPAPPHHGAAPHAVAHPYGGANDAYTYAPSRVGPGGSAVQGPADWQQRDFVCQRYRAFHPQPQQQDQPDATANIWLGVSDMERLLVSCCQADGSAGSSSSSAATEAQEQNFPQHHHDDVDESGDDATTRSAVKGALDRGLVLRFLTIVALHCHDLASRALALAILERSLEQDRAEESADADRRALEAEIRMALDGTTNTNKNVDDESSAKPPADEKEPPAKRLKSPPSHEESDGINSDVEKPDSRAGRCGRRIHRFLAAGGLRILHQWLIDASTPVEKPATASAAASTFGMAASMARSRPLPTVSHVSATGPLLLPLLDFLSSMPFDKNLIKKSKINKQIRSLSKDVDALAADPNVGADATHVESGGLPVRKVKGAVDRLKENWEEQAKSGANNKELFSNPLDPIQQALLERMRVLESFRQSDGGGGGADEQDKPEWLKKVEEQRRIKEKKKASKASKAAKMGSGGSTADMARKERANERAALMKEDLQRAQEQRRLLVIKLRELKQKNLQEEQKARHSKNKRSIRWKDGEGPASKFKKRELLEEVFIIPDRSSVDDDNADDEEVISLLEDDPDADFGEVLDG